MNKTYKLSGENLARFLNIQKTIKATRTRVSLMGGAPDFSQRQFREDILPSEGMTKNMDGLLTPSNSSLLEGEVNDAIETTWKRQEHRKAEFGFGYRDLRDEKSDWMLDELKIAPSKDAKNKLSRATEASQSKLRTITMSSVDGNVKKSDTAAQNQTGEIDMKLYDQISPDEERKIYNLICNRYGEESGRPYLLVRSMAAPSEKKIEEWTTTDRKSADEQKFSREIIECPKTKSEPKRDKICPDISEAVKNKMKSLVEIAPYCSTGRIQQRKTWKNVLRNKSKPHKMLHVSIKGESLSSTIVSQENSEDTQCKCGLSNCDCDRVEVKCKIHKTEKKCNVRDYEVDEVNNYLITCRKNLQDKHITDRRVTVLTEHAIKEASRVTRESVYLQSVHDQAQTELVTCLMKVMPPQGQEVSDTGFHHVEELADAVAERKMINDHEWRVWRYAQAKMENLENSDELDSFDSDIITSASSDGDHSECEIRYSERLQPSRIPYFKETYELANTLFEKIDAKLDKLVAKNHDSNKMLAKRPQTSILKEKLKLLKHGTRLFNQICKKIHFHDIYSKTHVPFSERKRRKRYRSNKMKLALNRTQNRRKLIEGVQLGKRYITRPKRSFQYTEEENYRGFSPQRQKFLRKPAMEKFRKCDLVGSDLSGRRLTKKVIHKDYRLIRRMFDDQLKRNKESLWDPGMKQRMEAYLGTFKEAKEPEEENEEVDEDVSDVSTGIAQKWPKKDEQKTQTALPSSWSFCSRSSGTAADTFASIIRSLRRDAGSRTGLGISNRGDETIIQGPRTATSFGRSTFLSSRHDQTEPCRAASPSSGSSKLGKTSQAPSVEAKLNRRPYTQNSSSCVLPFIDSSVHLAGSRSQIQRTPAPKMPPAKSIKTLPSTKGIKTSGNNVTQKFPWKSSKTAR